jgi:hypothetical protein
LAFFYYFTTIILKSFYFFKAGVAILGQVLLAAFQTTFVFFRLVEAFNCFISTPAHFSSKNNARAPHQDVQVPDRYRMACDQANRYTLMIPPPVEHDRANSS